MDLNRLTSIAVVTFLLCLGSGEKVKGQDVKEISPPQTGAPEPAEASQPEEEGTDEEDVEEELDEALQELKDLASAVSGFVRERREAFIEDWKDRSRKMEERIEELRKEGEKLAGETREQWDQRMKSLEEKQEDVKERLDEMSSDAGAGWRRLRRDLRDAWDDLSDEVDKAASEIRKSETEPEQTDSEKEMR